jgi:hypothetical protein
MITVVGGTYKESCLEPSWNQIYGSGLRGLSALQRLNPAEELRFVSFGDEEVGQYLKLCLGERIKSELHWISESPLFHYDYPLGTPQITPRPDAIPFQESSEIIKSEYILYYGCLEGNFVVNGKQVVYDPQSPANPKSFRSTGSSAEQLVVITNLSEARKLSGKHDLSLIKDYFFAEENAYAVVLKMGAKGAIVWDDSGSENVITPYKSDKVWPIGSGDVFAAIFSHFWFAGRSLPESADLASRATAIYCNSKDFPQSETAIISCSFPKVNVPNLGQKQIYLAGPFFNFAEKWLVHQCKMALDGFGVKVFSPWHDVGLGVAEEVALKDLDGLSNSDLIFAIVDGLDSGTLFEIGFAVSKGIPVVAFSQKETKESLKMLEGTHCKIITDLTTAVYHAIWMLDQHE